MRRMRWVAGRDFEEAAAARYAHRNILGVLTMRKCPSGAAVAARGAAVCIFSLITALGLPTPGQAADRCVLGEEFTDVWCYGCGYAGPALDILLDVYPDSFAFVQYHVYDEYTTPWSDDRFAFYDGLEKDPSQPTWELR